MLLKSHFIVHKACRNIICLQRDYLFNCCYAQSIQFKVVILCLNDTYKLSPAPSDNVFTNKDGKYDVCAAHQRPGRERIRTQQRHEGRTHPNTIEVRRRCVVVLTAMTMYHLFRRLYVTLNVSFVTIAFCFLSLNNCLSFRRRNVLTQLFKLSIGQSLSKQSTIYVNIFCIFQHNLR